MSKIWVFGDSFSAPFDNDEMGVWAKKYIQWKGYIPKTFSENLSDRLRISVNNFSLGGSDNNTIFDSLMYYAPNFKKSDIVIVGWSSIVRFRLADAQNDFRFILPNMDNSKLIIGISQNTIDEVLVNRTNDAYFREFKIRFNFLNWVLRDFIFIQWTPFAANLAAFNYNTPFVKELPKNKNISYETSREIDDTHLSESGHLDMADHFIALIDDYVARKLNNRILNKIL